MFLVCRVILQDNVINVSCEKEFIKTNCYPIKFGGHRPSGSGNITFLVCHAISPNLMIKRLYDFML